MRRAIFLPSLLGILFYALIVLIPTPSAAQNQEPRRVALVVGNFAYDHVPKLANPGNDAALIATTLRRLGFTLVGGDAQENIDKAHFDRLIQDFGKAIQGADVALFYYAGHGMQVNGDNWLVPTDANPTRIQDLEFQMFNADLVLKQMDGAGARLNLVILDACRNNPFAQLGTRAVQGGLAQMHAPEGTMISFATQPGNVAADGSGANGPFALALAASMQQSGLDIFHVFNRVGLTVQHETGGAQQPWVSSSPIDGDFYFSQSEATPDIIAATPVETPSATTPNAGDARNASPGASTAAPPDHGVATALADTQNLAGQGKADAQIALGLAYAQGQGVARDDVAARHWFGLAAAQGVAQAQYLTGAMLERGRGGKRSYTEALQWYKRAADQGYPSAEAAMGRFYGRGLGLDRDVKLRTDWYRRAADHGSAIGEWALGNFYQFGDGVEKDLPQARLLYERAASQNLILAEVRLGLMNVRGIGGQKDNAVALHWFQKAADAGNAVALNNLGAFYRHGTVVPQDYAQAMRLFRQAADKGNAQAAYNIGSLYAEGQGVKADRQQARTWFEKAAAAGNELAIKRLARLSASCGTARRGGPAPADHC